MININVDQKKTGVLLSYFFIALNSLVGVIYTPILLAKLGYSDYALYSLSANLIGFLVFLDFGLTNGLVRYFTIYLDSKKYKNLSSLYGMFLCVFLIISFLILIFGFLIYNNIFELYGSNMTLEEIIKLKKLLLIMFVTMAISFPFNLFTSILTANECFIFLKSVILIRLILNTSILIILLYNGFGIITLVLITSIFNFLVVFLNFIYCKFSLKIKITFKNFDFKKMKEVFKFSFLLFTVVIFEKLVWSSSQVILGMYVGTMTLAIFSIAFQLQQIFASFSTAFSGVFLPKVTSMYVNKSSNLEISNLFIKSGRLQFSLIFLVFSGFIIFGKSFIFFWAGNEYLSAYIMTLVFFTPLSFLSIQSLGMVILSSKNKLKLMSLVYLFTAIFSIVFQFIFVESFEIHASLFGVFIPMFIGPVILMNYFYQKKYGINILKFWKEIFIISRFPFLYFILSFLIFSDLEINRIIDLLFYISLYSIFYSLIYWNFSLNRNEKNMFYSFYNSLRFKKKFK